MISEIDFETRLNHLIELKDIKNNELNFLMNERSNLGQSRTPRELNQAIQETTSQLNLISNALELATISFNNFRSYLNNRRRANSRLSNILREKIENEREIFSQIIENFYLEANWLTNQVILNIINN